MGDIILERIFVVVAVLKRNSLVSSSPQTGQTLQAKSRYLTLVSISSTKQPHRHPHNDTHPHTSTHLHKPNSQESTELLAYQAEIIFFRGLMVAVRNGIAAVC